MIITGGKYSHTKAGGFVLIQLELVCDELKFRPETTKNPPP